MTDQSGVPNGAAVLLAQKIRSYADQIAASPDALYGCLDEIYRTTKDSLEETSPTEFGARWALYSSIGEILRYTIEDDAIDIRNLAKALSQSIKEAAAGSETAVFDSLLQVLHSAAFQKSVPRRRYRFKSRTGLVGTIWKAIGSRQIPVGASVRHEVPILEEMVCDPHYARNLVDGYTARILSFQKSHEIDHLCFVEKYAGPIGALPLATALVQRLSMPACIYRESYWLKRAQIAGVKPQTNARVAIVYDLVMSGNGIKQAVQKLRVDHRIDVVAAVVLYGYSGNRPQLDELGAQFPVSSLVEEGALDYYEDTKYNEDNNFPRSKEHSGGAQLPQNAGIADASITKEYAAMPKQDTDSNVDVFQRDNKIPMKSQQLFPGTPDLRQKLRATRDFFETATDTELDTLLLRVTGGVRKARAAPKRRS